MEIRLKPLPVLPYVQLKGPNLAIKVGKYVRAFRIAFGQCPILKFRKRASIRSLIDSYVEQAKFKWEKEGKNAGPVTQTNQAINVA